MTLQTIKSAVRFNESALTYALSEQVEDLDDLVKNPQGGREFFAKTHVTTGMSDLMKLGMKRLAGQSKQGVFELRQAMGGGKTHSMLSLGYLAANPNLSTEAGIDHVALERQVKIVVVNGRHIPHDRLLWGEIARQLGRDEAFAKFWRNGPLAPNETDWSSLIGEDPVLILIDELPAYLRGAMAVPVGGGNLGDATSSAVSNLLSASLKLPRLCIVLATLKASYEKQGAALTKLISELSQEAGRQAKPITPVELGSDEIYKILRKRLVSEMPPINVIESASEAFAQAISDAQKAKTLDKSVASYEAEIATTYPFHPSFKTILTIFKENEGFRQTRDLMTVGALMVKSALARRYDDVYLIGPQHLDFQNGEVRDKVATIYNLDAAITQDVAAIGNSPAHAQVIDDASGNDAATQAGSLLIMASLAQSADAVKGLGEPDLVSFLVSPNRSASEFRIGVEELVKKSWYLHRRDNGALYFSRNENLTKKIEQLAATAPENKIDGELKRRITEIFNPKRRIAYGKVIALPSFEELEKAVTGERVLIALKPDRNLPPEEAKRLFDGVSEKNNFAIVACDDTSFNNVTEHVKQAWAIQRVLSQEGENSPNRADLTDRLEAAQKDAYDSMHTAYDRIYYPASSSKGEALAHTPLRLDAHRRLGSDKKTAGFDGEAAVEQALSDSGSSKLRIDVEKEADGLIIRAQDNLWPEGDERKARRSDIERRAISNPRWVWLPRDGIDRLIRLAQGKELWIDHGDGWIEKGPFPKKKTDVRISERGTDRETGETTLIVAATVGGAQTRIHYSTKANVSTDDPMVEGGEVKTLETRLYFLAIDPNGNHETGDPKTWHGKITILHDRKPRHDGSGTDVTLRAVPKGSIRWNTQGLTPREGAPYDGPIFCLGDMDQTISVFAEADGVEATDKITVPRLEGGVAVIDKAKPARVTKRIKVNETGKVYDALKRAREAGATFDGIDVTVGENRRNMMATFGADVVMSADQIEQFITTARAILQDDQAPVSIVWKGLNVVSASDIDAIKSAIAEEIARSDIQQG